MASFSWSKIFVKAKWPSLITVLKPSHPLLLSNQQLYVAMLIANFSLCNEARVLKARFGRAKNKNVDLSLQYSFSVENVHLNLFNRYN